ncbi:MAG: hypothetical protein JO256_09000 [Alphaproteobacteria bacterium]|nr:hypothetical protein [Alphaproteobacteria bacterium]
MGIQENLRQTDAVLVCVARGHAGHWQALCLDFDLAVQGISLPEVKDRLEQAITDYVAAALQEKEPARSQLLGRRAPFWVRLVWAFRFFMGTTFGKNRTSDSTVGFPVLCHA